MKCLGTIFVPVLILFTYQAAASAESPPEPYLGETPPGLTPELFAPGVVSTNAVELNSVFTPDGREFFFTRLIDVTDGERSDFNLWVSRHKDRKWSAAEPLPEPVNTEAEE